MMNGTKKSDSSMVPVKPANKVERSTAELVEGSDGTKRNAELQSTVRTQSREAVTQAQARIRGAVTRNAKEKLTALLHHVASTSCGQEEGRVTVLTRKRASGAQWADVEGT
jgi:RNA-directed DNA polymerase